MFSRMLSRSPCKFGSGSRRGIVPMFQAFPEDPHVAFPGVGVLPDRHVVGGLFQFAHEPFDGLVVRTRVRRADSRFRYRSVWSNPSRSVATAWAAGWTPSQTPEADAPGAPGPRGGSGPEADAPRSGAGGTRTADGAPSARPGRMPPPGPHRRRSRSSPAARPTGSKASGHAPPDALGMPTRPRTSPDPRPPSNDE